MEVDLQYDLFCCYLCAIKYFFWCRVGNDVEHEGKRDGYLSDDFFLPTLVPQVAMAVLWMWLLNPGFGLINSMLSVVGIPGPSWLGSEVWYKPSLIFMSLWGIGQAVVIYLAGLTDISQDYYDAADVDGVKRFQKTFSVTLPLLTPVILYNLVMGVIGRRTVYNGEQSTAMDGNAFMDS